MTRLIFTLFATLIFTVFPIQETRAAVNTASVVNLNTASTSVTTGAYVTLSAAIPSAPSQLVIVNATASVIKFAYGVSGSEIDFVSVGASSTTVIENLVRHLPSGARLSVEAISATASSGYISVSLLQ